MSSHLFTIGYEGANLQKFLDCLEDNAVACLVDVREIPFSRKKGFSKTPLSVALEARGIQYVHFRELGSPASVRKELKSNGDYRKFFRAIEDHLAIHHDSIEQAYAYIRRMPCCLMCYERLAAMCHRKVVANRIKERDGNGLEVKHLKVH